MDNTRDLQDMLNEIKGLYTDILNDYNKYLVYDTYKIDQLNLNNCLGGKVKDYLSDKDVKFLIGLELTIGFEALTINRWLFQVTINFFSTSEDIELEIGNILLPFDKRESGRLTILLDKLVEFKNQNKFSGNVYLNDVSETDIWNYLKKKYRNKLNIILV